MTGCELSSFLLSDFDFCFSFCGIHNGRLMHHMKEMYILPQKSGFMNNVSRETREERGLYENIRYLLHSGL